MVLQGPGHQLVFAPVGLWCQRPGGKSGREARRLRRDPYEPDPFIPLWELWGKRSIRSVANLTQGDGEEFFRIAAEVPLRVAAEPLPLTQANEGLGRLRSGLVRGPVVLQVDDKPRGR
jgi:hypothetical protein